jgi:hypothetical protein
MRLLARRDRRIVLGMGEKGRWRVREHVEVGRVEPLPLRRASSPIRLRREPAWASGALIEITG